MHSVWSYFQMAGFFGFLLVPIAMLALLLGIASLLGGLIAKKSRPFTYVGALSIATVALGLGLGGIGTWYDRNRVEGALSGASIDDLAQLEKIWLAGYEEARAVPIIALVLLVLPLLIGLVGTLVSWLRSRDARGRRPMPDVAVAGVMTVFALGALVLASVSSLPAEETARQKALASFRHTATGLMKAEHCDPCPWLADAVEHRGIASIDDIVPGAKDRAHQCIDDWLKRIEEGKRAQPSCRARDAYRAPPPPRTIRDEPEVANPGSGGSANKPLTDREKALRDAAEFGILGLLGAGKGKAKDRKGEIEALLASPLLFDDAQRRRAEAMLEDAKKPRAKDATDEENRGGVSERTAPADARRLAPSAAPSP